MNVYKRFESLKDFEAYLQANKVRPKFVGREESQRVDDWGERFGTKTFREAEMLFRNGDYKTASAVVDGVAKKTANMHRHTRQISSGVCGFAPHVPNFIAGRPNSMIRTEYKPTKARVLNLVYNISVNGDVSAQQMKQAAIKMLSAIKAIENNGTRINLYVADISGYETSVSPNHPNGVKYVGWTLKIKSSTQHLDVLKTAYPLCNPAMLRRHSFRFTEVTKNINKKSYGWAKKDVSELCNATGIKNAVQIAFADATNKSIENLINFIFEQVAKKH